MSLGKGLEALIPPKKGDGDMGGAALPQEPPKPSANLVGHHQHIAGAGAAVGDASLEPQPAILSFDFTDSPAADSPAVADQVYAETASAVHNYGDIAQDPPEKYAPVYEEKERATAEPARFSDYVFHIEVAKISPNPNQPRRNFDESALWELAKSIREFGFLQPLVVTRREAEVEEGVDVQYELVAGERRLLAAKLLGLEYVPAIVRNVSLEREKLELAVIENIQREDLNPVERARAFQRLQEEFRLTQREIAAKLGKSRETVANTVRLLDLPVYIQEALEKGHITESHGRFLLQVSDPSAQKKLFDDITVWHLTTRDLKARVQSAKPKKTKNIEAASPELKALEEKLTAELGTPVKIERSSFRGEAGANADSSATLGTGKIVITFYSEEELRSIVSRFGGQELP